MERVCREVLQCRRIQSWISIWRNKVLFAGDYEPLHKWGRCSWMPMNWEADTSERARSVLERGRGMLDRDSYVTQPRWLFISCILENFKLRTCCQLLQAKVKVFTISSTDEANKVPRQKSTMFVLTWWLRRLHFGSYSTEMYDAVWFISLM